MKCWHVAVCLVCCALLFLLIAASAKTCAVSVPPTVQGGGPCAVREAPDDVAADAEPEIQCFVKGD